MATEIAKVRPRTPTVIDRVRARIDNRFGTYRGLIRLLLAHAEWRTGRLRDFTAPELIRVRRVVFVCQGNICRSAFADWCGRARGMRTASVGLATGTDVPAYPDAVETARRFGIDLSAHRTTDIGDFRFADGDLVLAMEVRQCRRLAVELAGMPLQIGLLGCWSLPRRPHIHDPHGMSREYFHTCFVAIASGVERLAARLEEVAAPAIGSPGPRDERTLPAQERAGGISLDRGGE